jgi:hypothetical protein
MCPAHFFVAAPINQVCQMVCFQTKNSKLGKLLRVFQWKMLVYFMTIWPILRPVEIIYVHSVYFSRFGMLYQEKSGNPAIHSGFWAARFCARQETFF